MNPEEKAYTMLVRVLLKSDQVWEIVVDERLDSLCDAVLQAIGCSADEVDVLPLPAANSPINAMLVPLSLPFVTLKHRVQNLGKGQRIGIDT